MTKITKKIIPSRTVKYNELLRNQKRNIFTIAGKLRNELQQIEQAEITNLEKILGDLGVTLEDPIFKQQNLSGILSILQSRKPVDELRNAVTKLTKEPCHIGPKATVANY